MQSTIEPTEFECQGFKCRFGPRNSEWPSRVQAQVIACIAAGMTHKEIAKLRGCSPRTISATSAAARGSSWWKVMQCRTMFTWF